MARPAQDIARTIRNEGGEKSFMLFIAPLLLVNLFLLAVSHLWANIHSVKLSNSYGLIYSAMIFPILFLGFLSAILLFESIWRAKEFIEDETGQVNIRALWSCCYSKTSPLTGTLVVFAMGLGITGSSYLSEIYRLTTRHWFDEKLWGIEEPVFLALLGSWLNMPSFWDKIYFLIWPVLFSGMALVYKSGCHHQFIKIVLAVVIAFYATRLVNLLLPTAGPAFFKPELFSLGGTLSVTAQEGLRLYMLGHMTQNGLIPGTMAMPSLHVGLAAMTVWVIACQWRWTLWLTIPWLLLIWLSTVMLGWHYALDGIGGILVMGLSILIAHHILKAWHSLAAVFRKASYPL